MCSGKQGAFERAVELDDVNVQVAAIAYACLGIDAHRDGEHVVSVTAVRTALALAFRAGLVEGQK